MICESYRWKEELAKDLRAVKRRISKNAMPGDESHIERVVVAIEKFAFTSAFILRKLAEGYKLSDEIESRSLPIQSFRRIDGASPTNPFPS